MSEKTESVLQVLMYIFKNYMSSSCDTTLSEETILAELASAGFDRKQIFYALDWLKGLIDMGQNDNLTNNSKYHTGQTLRIYNEEEQDQLSIDCRGMITQLEQIKILNTHTRELVIDRLLALEAEGIDLALVKWVSLMVLFNQGDDQTALEFMEYLTLNETGDGLH